jgi:hypothetical protein
MISSLPKSELFSYAAPGLKIDNSHANFPSSLYGRPVEGLGYRSHLRLHAETVARVPDGIRFSPRQRALLVRQGRG